VSIYGRDGLPGSLLDWMDLELVAIEDATRGASNTLRVRGRFNFRSGSWDGSAGEAGEVVVDLDFLFRVLGILEGVLSISFAFSNAPQALASSGVSAGTVAAGRWSRRRGAEFRKTLPAPCLAAMSNRRCHCSNSARSLAVCV